MGVRLRWSRQSTHHLVAIRRYVAQYDPEAAERVRLQITATVRLLQALPRLGHPGRTDGTREFVVPRLPYVIVYRTDIGDEDELVILGIFHGARER